VAGTPTQGRGDDVLRDRLPQVSWIIATEEGSEHPDSSSGRAFASGSPGAPHAHGHGHGAL
jgi:phospholipase C